MVAVRIFIDFWNFQLGWNQAFPVDKSKGELPTKIDWKSLPTVLMNELPSALGGEKQSLQFKGVNVYASVNPDPNGHDTGLKNFPALCIKRTTGALSDPGGAVRGLAAGQDDRIEPGLVDDQELLGTAKGIDSSDTLFIGVEPRCRIARVPNPKLPAHLRVCTIWLDSIDNGAPNQRQGAKAQLRSARPGQPRGNYIRDKARKSRV